MTGRLVGRFLMLSPDTNPGKILSLEALQSEYMGYVKICVNLLIERRVFSLKRISSVFQTFFPPAEKLTSQIEKNARAHAVDIVSGWTKAAYTNSVKPEILRLRKDTDLSDEDAKALFTIGKYSKQKPDKTITQDALDTYWYLLLDLVKPPRITERIGMRMSEMTCRLESPEEALHADLWFRASSLGFRKSLWLPLVSSPYVKSPKDVGKGFLVRKTKDGRWRFEALSTEETVAFGPEISPDAPSVGIDVGLNVMVATSDGRLYGADFKPKFNRLYDKVKALRANRFRQGLKENSRRLDRLEGRLSGLMKSAVGRVTNQLVQDYPGYRFVIEDLDLRGCKGQKRYCYRGIHHSLEVKVRFVAVNPAYTSQMCPSCGYISRRNRRGTEFRCLSCGRRSHADVVGAINLLGRSEDKQFDLKDDLSDVRRTLRERYRDKRNSSLGPQGKIAPTPIGQKLTVGAPGLCKVSNSISDLKTGDKK